MNTSTVIVPFVVSLTISLLLYTSLKKPKEDEQGNKILVFPKFYFILGIFSMVASIGIVILGIFTAEQEDVLIVILITAMFLGMGLPLFFIGKNFQLIITPKELIHTNIFNKTRTIKWEDIVVVSYGKISQELKIETETEKIKIHQHAIGFPFLIEEIESRTEYTRKSLGIPFLRKKNTK